ncbi:uncharacterized protein LOC122660280 isoform X2 [Telopea speciosissima]|nr:uncharacterized protein LOC122660280 isoform X2 [Telopea speciosissima]
MLLLMNQQQQPQPPPPFLPPVLVSVSLTSSMGEQTEPQVPVQTQIHHHPQPHPQSQPSNQPQTQPQVPIQSQSQIQSQTQLQPLLQPPQPQSRLQPQPELQTQTQTETQTQPLPGNTPQLQPDATSQTVDATTAVACPPQNSSSASKIPIRSRKIRKLSADVSTDNSENKAPQAVDGDTTTINTAAAAATSEMVTTTTVVHNSNMILVQPIRVIPRIVGKTLSCAGEVAAAIRHLRTADPLLARVIDVYQPPSFDTFHPPFLALTKSILYQQLAYKAGTTIYTRFISLCGGEAGVVPDAVLSFSLHQLRQIGVSARKASYLHDLASKYRKGILSDASIIDMDDKSLFAMVTMVNGIGPWSVHMFMIFSLHRPDVLPIGDLGVRKGVQLLYGLEQLPRPSQMEQLCEKWRPYRSVGTWYMWRFAEAKGAQASATAVAVGAGQPQLQQQPQPQPQQHQHLDPINGIESLG